MNTYMYIYNARRRRASAPGGPRRGREDVGGRRFGQLKLVTIIKTSNNHTTTSSKNDNNNNNEGNKQQHEIQIGSPEP